MANNNLCFIVELPKNIELRNIHKIKKLESIKSTSTASGAVSRAVFRKVSKEVAQEERRTTARVATDKIKSRYGELGIFAYEIPTDIEGEDQELAQEVFLAQIIAQNRKSSSPEEYLPTARRYLAFYHQNK